jgi:CheY-specific phosphatase CheX
MAKNLREKIDKSDTMVINDVNDAATQKFVEEVGNVTIAKTVREVAEQTVRRATFEAEMTCPAFPQSLSSDVNCSINDPQRNAA